MTKILFYYTHKESLGHTMRTFALIDEFRRMASKKVKLFLFQAGIQQKFIQPPKGVVLINVPFPFYSRACFKKQDIEHCYMGFRADFMLERIRDINPDIFITEFFPFGRLECAPELLTIMAYLRKRKRKIYASIGYPNISFGNFKNQEIFNMLIKFFDKLFIHTPEELENRYYERVFNNEVLNNQYNLIFSRLKDKIIYTGYVLPFNANDINSDNEQLKYFEKGKHNILVSRGGGVVYPKLLLNAILSNKYLDNSYNFLVVSGPSAGNREYQILDKLVTKNNLRQVKIVNCLKGFHNYIKSCDVSINMAGYNTAVQLLYFWKKSVVIPYDASNRNSGVSDQLPRALLLKDYLKSEVVDYASVTPELLANKIKESLCVVSPKKSLSRTSFLGAKITVKNILS